MDASLSAGSIFSPLAVVGSLDQDYRYKPVSTQIPNNTVLATVHLAGEPNRDRCMRDSDSICALRWRTSILSFEIMDAFVLSSIHIAYPYIYTSI